jgi:tRNA(fMet)-specific endonuclease VapC
MRNDHKIAIQLLDSIQDKYVSIITVAELYFGAYKSARKEANLKVMQGILDNFTILYIDDYVAHSYALIKTNLQKNGTPIPDNDIWIAATAHANNISVATFDDHFNYVSQIKVIQ